MFCLGSLNSKLVCDERVPHSIQQKLTCALDEFAVKLGYSTELAKSLIKLQVQNLATMDADWMYSSYHYTHPILPERLSALGWKGGKVE